MGVYKESLEHREGAAEDGTPGRSTFKFTEPNDDDNEPGDTNYLYYVLPEDEKTTGEGQWMIGESPGQNDGWIVIHDNAATPLALNDSLEWWQAWDGEEWVTAPTIVLSCATTPTPAPATSAPTPATSAPTSDDGYTTLAPSSAATRNSYTGTADNAVEVRYPKVDFNTCCEDVISKALFLADCTLSLMSVATSVTCEDVRSGSGMTAVASLRQLSTAGGAIVLYSTSDANEMAKVLAQAQSGGIKMTGYDLSGGETTVLKGRSENAATPLLTSGAAKCKCHWAVAAVLAIAAVLYQA
jgi:hypothetical protein